MRIIAHRGLLDGPDRYIENTPEQIEIAISEGFDVEIDVQKISINTNPLSPDFDKSGMSIGHDTCDYFISFDTIDKWMEKYPDVYFWFHIKHLDAVSVLHDLSRLKMNYFLHNKDDAALTSNGLIWTFPGKPINRFSIDVLPELKTTPSQFKTLYQPARIDGTKVFDKNLSKPYGVCTDFAHLLKKAIV